MLGQGSKICPHSDVDSNKTEHTCATRQLLQERLRCDRDYRVATSSPTRDIFQKTSTLITALRTVGCSAPEHEQTVLTPAEQEHKKKISENEAKRRRGYVPSTTTCQGRLSLEYDGQSKPFVMYISTFYESCSELRS